jgi:ribosomal protein S18 acetylase RimI-like enzyme/predicted nucleic acid-binding protein
MSASRFLIDTNVFIGLEDNTEVAPHFALLQQLAGRHGVEIFVHEAAIDDIRRDKDETRKRVSLSKLNKFPVISKMTGTDQAVLEPKYGSIRRPNDLVDSLLLHALDIGVADFLVTEDQRLHQRAETVSPTLGARVLYVADAVSFLRSSYEPIAVVFPAVEEMEANTISQLDPIFESLRGDYPGFDLWWREKCVKPMRKCWVVMDEDRIAGLIVRKEEKPGDTDAMLPGQKILKICTFKVRTESRGVKLGELLLKQVLWYAQSNNHDVVYLTTFEEQQTLIALLAYYGFRYTHDNSNGERVYEKSINRARLLPVPDTSLFDLARANYPRFATGLGVSSYVIPIQEEYHEILFPELVNRSQLSLFGGEGFHRPGNTIRKVYLCRAPAKLNQPGALLFFYKSKSNSTPSQAITTIGVLEEMKRAYSPQQLFHHAGGRSVYSDKRLSDMVASEDKPVKVINFLLAAHIEPPVSLTALNADNVFAGSPPQSIMRLNVPQQLSILRQSKLGFEV